MSLVQGRDYYIENGFWVFTEKFHIEKGMCCENQCRHCPYQSKTELKPEIKENLQSYLQKEYPSSDESN
ncbi:MAG: DUF5522 domain-containing protein [Bdellovibrionota bacterium]|nr:hypothetical protein [Pseudobdellovibrionaceae bacterium]|tara:strand:- start:41550 stop:41756 length:207 start_codon:yes stop_codon:yes gene_type:complete